MLTDSHSCLEVNYTCPKNTDFSSRIYFICCRCHWSLCTFSHRACKNSPLLGTFRGGSPVTHFGFLGICFYVAMLTWFKGQIYPTIGDYQRLLTAYSTVRCGSIANTVAPWHHKVGRRRLY